VIKNVFLCSIPITACLAVKMAKVYEEIKKLHTENLFDDLKIVVSILTC